LERKWDCLQYGLQDFMAELLPSWPSQNRAQISATGSLIASVTECESSLRILIGTAGSFDL
jgi:hypothetical protein